MEDRQATQVALLEWINYFPLPSKIKTTRELNDGIVLWKILCQIDPDYFQARQLHSSSTKNADSWLPKWQNVKQIYKDLVGYIRDECMSNLSLAEGSVPDAKAIAEWAGDASFEMVKLLKIMVIAAISSPKANEFLGQIATSREEMQAVMKSVIEELTTGGEEASGSMTPDEGQATGRDRVHKRGSAEDDLVLEERLAKIQTEKKELALDKKDLQQEVSELHDRLARLQDNNQVLQSQLTKAEDRLGGSGSKGYGADADAVIKRLETTVHEQEDIIADHEYRLSDALKAREEQGRLIESLQPASNKATKLQDELDEIKIERNNLAKKANALDKYKQKLQASQGLETENRELRSQAEETQKQLTKLEAELAKAEGLQLTIEKYQQTISQIEMSNFDLQTLKRQFEIDKAVLLERLESSSEQRTRDEETIADLQEKVSSLELGVVPSGPDDEDDLESELTENTVKKSDLKREIAKLKADLQRAKTSSASNAQNVMLGNLLSDAKKKVDSLETKYLDVSREKQLLEHQWAMLKDGPIFEGNKTFITMREEKAKAQAELASLSKKYQALELELSGLRRELTAATSKLSLLDEPEAEALAKLEAANASEVADLRKENARILDQHKELVFSLDEQKSLVNKTLIKLSKHQDEREESQGSELHETLELLKAAATKGSGHDGTDQEAMKQRLERQEDELTKGRRRIADQAKEVETHLGRLKALEAELAVAKEGEKTAVLKAQHEQLQQQKSSQSVELENLYRENALMATAWYDLSSRLQQNNVDLQRRAEPRSWLNRQRGLLGGGGAAAAR